MNAAKIETYCNIVAFELRIFSHCSKHQIQHTADTHICNSHKPTHRPKIAKECALSNRKTREKKKHESTTKAIRNAGFSSKLKVRTFKLHLGRLKVKYYKIPHYA